MSKYTIKVESLGAYNVKCPTCHAQKGFTCFTIKNKKANIAAELKRPHPARVRAAIPASTVPIKRSRASLAAANKRAKSIPAGGMLDASIESLRELRRRLCVYMAPASDKFCDCKVLQHGTDIRSRSGEASGCVETRLAIRQLEVIKRAMSGGDDGLCQHCGHGRELHSISRGLDQACTRCTCKKFRKRLNLQ